MKKYKPGEKSLLMSQEQVRAFDAWAINELGVPGMVLMENAGRSCPELIEEKFSAADKPRVCIFCGTGNNGGDGFVIARHLLNGGFRPVIVLCGKRGKIKGDARANLGIIEELGVPIEQLDVDASDDIDSKVKSPQRTPV